MLITRETDYALRMISALSSGEKLTTAQMCEKELTPKQFGYKILKKLSKAGVIRIIRGNGGGCILDCDLKKVSLYDLMTIMGEDIHVTACMDSEFDCERRKKLNQHCVIHNHLALVQDAFDMELKSHSLYQVLGLSH